MSTFSELTDDIIGSEKERKEKKCDMKMIFMTILPWCLTVVFMIAFFVTLGANSSKKDTSTSTKPCPTPEPIDNNSLLPLNGQTYADRIEGAFPSIGKFNHINSRYYPQIDLYNAKSSGSFKIIEGVRVYQQTSEFDDIACLGVSVANYYGIPNINETYMLEITNIGTDEKLNTHNQTWTYAEDAAEGFKKIGINSELKKDHPNLEMAESEASFRDWLEDCIDKGDFLLLATNDWGSHYQMVIGLDTMGTTETEDDVVITADTYDTSDHRMDGYNIWSLERLYHLWCTPVRHLMSHHDAEFQFIRLINPKRKQ